MKGELSIIVNLISGGKIAGDPYDVSPHSDEELRDQMVQLSSMFKNPSYIIVCKDDNPVVIQGQDISSVALSGSTKELKELLREVV